ncbi:MAG: recombination mediator RecR [Phycisphaerae bacterium]
MDGQTSQTLANLIERLARLPGIGPRTAERLAFHLLKADKAEVLALADAIRDMKTRLRHCSVCYNLTETDPCRICSDPRRDHSQIVVVEQPKDVAIIEQTGLVRGVYHVLLGCIAPLEGIEPNSLTIPALKRRAAAGQVKEVVLATNPTLEGDGTALYIHSLLASLPIKVTRLARGLPAGSQLEYAPKAVLEDALKGRTEM